MTKTDLLLLIIFGFQLFTFWYIRSWLLDIHDHVVARRTDFYHTFMSAYRDEDDEEKKDAD